jgi:hypothetical protein
MARWQYAFAFGCALVALSPLASQASWGGYQDRERWGAIKFHPNSITIGLQLGKGGGATFRVSQKDREGQPYEGKYRGDIQCDVNLLNKPRLDIDGHMVTVIVPRQLVVVSALCYATIVGGGGVTGIEPITIDVGL